MISMVLRIERTEQIKVFSNNFLQVAAEAMTTVAQGVTLNFSHPRLTEPR